jgi:small subunit ribosomal protein S20
VANHKSAIKRARQNITRKANNAGYRTRAKSAIQEVRTAIAQNGVEDARLSLVKAVSVLQKVQSKGIIHKNTASRKISRLSRQVNQLSVVPSEGSTDEKSDSPQ